MNTQVTFNSLAIRQPSQQNGQSQNFNRERATVDENSQQVQPGSSRRTAEFVARGELLDSLGKDKQYKPQFNQQIAPQNRTAIEQYATSSSISVNDDPRGRLLDQYV